MKLSNLLYLIILPLLLTPSLNASKDSNTAQNVESVAFVEDFSSSQDRDRRCARDLRSCETANRYLEKELYVVEDELSRANRRIKRMQQKIRDYEAQLDRYQKRNPRRPRAHGYGDGRGQGNKYKKY